jgi:hypothetical protein
MLDTAGDENLIIAIFERALYDAWCEAKPDSAPGGGGCCPEEIVEALRFLHDDTGPWAAQRADFASAMGLTAREVKSIFKPLLPPSLPLLDHPKYQAGDSAHTAFERYYRRDDSIASAYVPHKRGKAARLAWAENAKLRQTR